MKRIDRLRQKLKDGTDLTRYEADVLIYRLSAYEIPDIFRYMLKKMRHLEYKLNRP